MNTKKTGVSAEMKAAIVDALKSATLGGAE